jgi:hypothetical protein
MSAASLAIHGMTATNPWMKACGKCRRQYDAAAWLRLSAVAMLTPQSVQAHLTVRAAWTVELRRCDCGVVLAARCP